MTPRRSIGGLLSLALLAAGSAVFFLSRPATGPVAPVEPVKPVTPAMRLHPETEARGRLEVKGTRTFSLTTKGGNFLEITVEQLGIDLTVTLLDAAGRARVVVDDSSLGERGTELLPALIEESGNYRIEIKPTKDYGHPGRYAIRYTVRQPSPQDRLRALAAHELTNAAPLVASDSPTAALPFLNRASAYAEQAKDHQQMTAALYLKGLALLNASHYEEARDALRHAGERYRALGSDLGYADALNNGGVALYHLDDLEGALNNRQTARGLYERVGGLVGSLGIASVYRNMAVTHHVWGEYQAAADCYQKALEIWPLGAEERRRIGVVVNLGVLLSTLADYDQARHKFQEALRLAEPLELDGELACTKLRALGGLGHAYAQDRRKVSQAVYFFQQALRLSQRCADVETVTVLFNGIGGLYLKRPDVNLSRYLARSAFQKAYDQSIVAKDEYNGMNALTGLARLDVLEENPEKGRERFDIALSVRKKQGYLLGIAGALYGRAQAERAMGDLDAAQASIAESLEAIEQLRREPGADMQSVSLFASRRQNFDFSVSLWMEEHKRDPRAGFAAKAFEVSERARGRALLDWLSGEEQTDETSPELEEPKGGEEEQDLRRRLQEAGRKRIQLGREIAAGRVQNGERQVEALTGEIKDLLVELDEIQGDSRSLDLEAAEPLTLPEIQEQVLDEKTLLLAYWFGGEGEGSYLWAVDRASVTVHTFAPGAKKVIERLVARINAGLLDRESSPGEILRDLSSLNNLILSPVASRLEGRRLLIVADGALQSIPFSLLQDPRAPVKGQPESGENWDLYQPLLERHAVVMLPSASILGVLRRESQGRPRPPNEVATISDPVFRLDDERVFQEGGQSEERSAALDNTIPNLKRLEYTKEEADAILALADPAKSYHATGFTANVEEIKNANLGQYKIVHFATHAIVDTLPELSKLALSAFRENGLPRNGALRAIDISRMHLPVDLVVLSACETGVGTTVAGEGVFNLSRAFFYAGAERVVVTHWRVDDQATSEFMKIFYKNMLKERLEPSDALRAAQRTIRQNPKWAHPYFWGGFVLQGEW